MEFNRASFNGDGLNNPLPQYPSSLPGVCCCGGTPNLMKLNWVREFVTLLKPTIGEEVEKAVKRAFLVSSPSCVLSSSLRSTPREVESSATRRLQLRFVGDLPEDLLTLIHIQDEGASLKVELCDDSGSRVEFCPESSVKIMFVVLDGDFEVDDRDDWTNKDFCDNIVQQRKGRRPLLVGECEIFLHKGVADVRNIMFTDNSKWMRSGNFRLGVQVIKGLPSGVVIKPAVSKAFKVKEKRLQSHRKHKVPDLEDFVWRLDNIAKNGPICQRLANEEVYTVKDLLQMYHADEKRLQNILRVSEKKWLEIIKSAESCTLPKEYYTFFDDMSGLSLLLDCVFNIKSVTLEGQSSQLYGTLDDPNKELANRSRIHAYEKRSELQKVYPPTNLTSTCIEPMSSPCNISTHKRCYDANSVEKGSELQNNYVSTHQMSVQAESMYPTSVADVSMQSFDASSCEIYGPTNQTSLEAQSAYPSSLICTNTQLFDATSPNQDSGDTQLGSIGNSLSVTQRGMQVHNIGLLNPTYSLDLMDDQETEIWIRECLNHLQEEASGNERVTIKLKTACYVTKAALKFMISVPPRKKQKVQYTA